MGSREQLVWNLLEGAATYRSMVTTLDNYVQLCELRPEECQRSRDYNNLLLKLQVLYNRCAVCVSVKDFYQYEITRQIISQMTSQMNEQYPAVNQMMQGWKIKETFEKITQQ
jgi:hypothetical protein